MEDKRNRLVDVAQYIGHRSLSTTVNCYWHVDLGNLYNRLQFPSGWCLQKKRHRPRPVGDRHVSFFFVYATPRNTSRAEYANPGWGSASRRVWYLSGKWVRKT